MSAPQAFDEGFLSEHADPLDAREQGFDWDALFMAFGEAVDGLEPTEVERLSYALHEVLSWLVAPYADKKVVRTPDRVDTRLKIIANRVLALAWLVSPGLVAGSPSLTEMSRQLACDKMELSKHVARARRKWGLRNRASDHAANFDPGKETS